MTGAKPLLPVLERRDEIRAAIERHRVVIVCGATGSGKTTQLPQICLAMGLPGVIGHTQPRRLAARAVAARIAEERGETVGDVVGAKVRFQDQTGPRTRIKVMTDGMLLAELASDPALSSYGTIIIDEAHERSLNIDFLIGYLRALLDRRRDLKVIITSATIDPEKFSRHFGGPAVAPVIEVSGRLFPVEIRYRPSEGDDRAFADGEAIADAVEDLPGAVGDALVFLPGEREIRQAADALRRRGLGHEVLPLFSRLSQQDQDRIFHPSGGRRVVLATNIAETSLTVPGIKYVIDTGAARLGRYDPSRKIQALPIEPVSRASADQRAGRCGRVEAGVCVRLYAEESYRARPAFTEPEIRRTSLASVILRMKSLGLGRVEAFPFLDPPDAASIRDGYETLFELGAIGSTEPGSPLTPVGERMARIPADPRIARMLIAADNTGVTGPITVLAAALSIQDPRERPGGRQEEADRAQVTFRDERSDFLTLLRLWDQYRHAERTMSRGGLVGWCRDHFLSPVRMREWSELIEQLRQTCDDIGLRAGEETHPDEADDAIHRALLTGLISNVACREGEAGSFEYRGVRGNKVQIFPGSVLFKKAPKWIMAAEVVHTTRLYARTVARIEPEWIEELAGHMFQHQVTDAHFDAESGEPSAWERVTMSGIVVVPRRRTPLARLDPAGARAMLIREGLVRGKLESQLGFVALNREVMGRAQQAEARLRRRDVLSPERELEAWFARRLPEGVVDRATLEAWCGEDQSRAQMLELPLGEVLRPEARRALDPALYPEEMTFESEGGPAAAPLAYRWSAGQEEDGITVTVLLEDLPNLRAERLDWLVPGWLEEMCLALCKTLPKATRARLEKAGPLTTTAHAIAGLVSFGEGKLETALSEAAEAVAGFAAPPAEWSLKSLPAHLRMRVRVTDTGGRELGAGRDLSELLERFEGKLRKVRAAKERRGFERQGLTDWTFGELPEQVEGGRYAALVDAGDSVTLTLRAAPEEAAALTYRGVRRLLALACRDELPYYLEAHPSWREAARLYGAFGDEADLRRAVSALVADRVFLDGQSLPRNESDFRARLEAGRGRLATAAREVVEALHRVLEARGKVAQRFSGGTPRLWADSVADIREQAAYLMPAGFLHHLTWGRFREYPRYAEAMRARLFALREEGIRAETEALSAIRPHWKRFTGWVAAAMSAEKARAEQGEAAAVAATKSKAPLPQARRAAPVVNVDAGAWAMRPGAMPAAVEQYRWALEEARAGLFGGQGRADLKGLERLWAAAQR